MDGVIEQVTVPDIGDFDEVDVVEVLVTAGDRVDVEDPLITLESDKATMDVPAPRAGKVVEVKVKAGDRIGTGGVILTLAVEPAAESVTEPTGERSTTDDRSEARLASQDEVDAALGEPETGVEDEGAFSPEKSATDAGTDGDHPSGEPTAAGASPPAAVSSESLRGPAPVDEFPTTQVYASPSVRRFARQLGVDLTRVKGTGRKERILKEDVEGFVKKVMSEPAGAGGSAVPAMPVIDFSKFGEIERQPLSRVQQLSLTNLHRSWLNVPHVTQLDQADVTELEAFRKSQKGEAEARGVKLTPVAFVMRACVAALQRFPWVNGSLDPDGEHVIVKHYYHLGVAVDTDQGLVVPVIRDVDRKGIFELAAELGEVSERARQGRLRLDEMRGASFTITSLGGIGGTAFTPIVNAPEVAILGLSRLETRPVWNGHEFEPRLMLPLSLSYDHRVIDGAMAVRFTTYLSGVLSDIRQLLL